MSVAVRFAVRRSDDAELGALAMSSIAFAITAAIGVVSTPDPQLGGVWPFMVAPLIATESLWGVVFSALVLRRSELVGRWLVLGAALIVAGGALIGVSR